MALTIVRNDIVNMRVDAIVNSTNRHLRSGGSGVDAGIHYAAGPKLAAELKKIGFCPEGSAVVTDSYGISSCRYIIHVVGPRYVDGTHGEAQILQECYRSILLAAREKKCRSVAIPSISTGVYGYPKREAYRIATRVVREFLMSLPEDEEMMVYFVLFDDESMEAGSRETPRARIREFIDSRYPARKKALLRRSGSIEEDRYRIQTPEKNQFIAYRAADEDAKETRDSPAPAPFSDTAGGSARSQEEYRDQDLNFAQMCEWWCARKGLPKKTFYISANINKSMFWNMKHHPEQIPKKTNALACAIGLKLDYDETQDLLMRAGMTLSRYYELDNVVSDFIERNNYDIFEINEELFERDLSLLGAT